MNTIKYATSKYGKPIFIRSSRLPISQINIGYAYKQYDLLKLTYKNEVALLSPRMMAFLSLLKGLEVGDFINI